MQQAGHDQFFDIAHDLFERFGGFRRADRQGGFDLARLGGGLHAALFDVLSVVCNQVDHGIAMLAEFFGGHR